jgi:hypothetical protein
LIHNQYKKSMTLLVVLVIVLGLIMVSSALGIVISYIKGNPRLTKLAIGVFAVSAIGCGLSAYFYAQKVWAYAQSNEFQNDVKKGAELAGKTVVSATSGAAKSAAAALDDEAIAQLANKSASIAGKSIKTITAAMDSTLGSKNVFMDQNLANAGLEIGRAEAHYKAGKEHLGVFINYKQDFKGNLTLTNYDQTGKVIEAATLGVIEKAGQGKVTLFQFEYSELGLTTYYILSKAN